MTLRVFQYGLKGLSTGVCTFGSPRRGESFCSTGWKPQSGDYPVLREKKSSAPWMGASFCRPFYRKKRRFHAKIATGDYDAIIIGHTQLEKLPLSRERQERFLRDQIRDITDGIIELKNESGDRFSIKQMATSENLGIKACDRDNSGVYTR